MKKPIYSICICNYNMEDTLERALESVASQLDSSYEILVVDDASSDTSLQIINQMKLKYPIIRTVELAPDRKRKLGETRNISVRESLGEYVILHVDADDVWEPYIKDFISIFHRIENCLGRDFLLSGQQINMGKKSYLLDHGPYRNTGRLEDRELWTRLAAINAYIPLDHRLFRHRLSRPKKRLFWKSIFSTWDRLLFDLRSETTKMPFVVNNLIGVVFPKYEGFSFRNRLFRSIFIVPSFFVSIFQEPLTPPESMRAHNAFANYREKARGTYGEIMSRNGCNPSLAFLNSKARDIFK